MLLGQETRQKGKMMKIVTALQTRDAARYLSLLSAGFCVFIGLVIFEGLAEVRWHSNYHWIKLDAYLISGFADLALWAVAFGLSVLPFYLGVARNRSWLQDRVLMFSSLALPLASITMLGWSREAALAGLAGSGFLVAYGLATRSSSLLRIPARDAFRVIAVVPLLCLAAVSLIGAVGLALGGAETLRSVTSSPTLSSEALSSAWTRATALDLESFFIFRPVLPLLIVILALAAIAALFWERIRGVTRFFRAGSAGKTGPGFSGEQTEGHPNKRSVALASCLLIVASVLIGIYLTLYPYYYGGVSGVLGSDSDYYLAELRNAQKPLDLLAFFRGSDRPLFMLFLVGLQYLTRSDPVFLLIHVPAMLCTLMSLSTFVLVREGTGDTFFASIAAFLSVISSQTAIGLGAAIFANWFALALANVLFALLVRAQIGQSRAAIAMASTFSFLVLFAHIFTWVACAAMLVVQGLSILSLPHLRVAKLRREGVPIACIILPSLILSLIHI